MGRQPSSLEIGRSGTRLKGGRTRGRQSMESSAFQAVRLTCRASAVLVQPSPEKQRRPDRVDGADLVVHQASGQSCLAHDLLGQVGLGVGGALSPTWRIRPAIELFL